MENYLDNYFNFVSWIYFTSLEHKNFQLTMIFDFSPLKIPTKSGILDDIIKRADSKINRRYDNCFYKIKSGIKGTEIVKTE